MSCELFAFALATAPAGMGLVHCLVNGLECKAATKPIVRNEIWNMPHGSSNGEAARSRQITSPPESRTAPAISIPMEPPPPVTVSEFVSQSRVGIGIAESAYRFRDNKVRHVPACETAVSSSVLPLIRNTHLQSSAHLAETDQEPKFCLSLAVAFALELHSLQRS